MAYVDGFVIPLKKKNLEAYRKMAQKAGKIFRKNGALAVWECAGDDYGTPCGKSFSKLMKLKPSETVMFSWVRFKSKAHRDQVNKRIMKDPRMATFMDPKTMPFDMNRMVYSGFKVIVAV